MVERFEVGKVYRWVGPADYSDHWDDDNMMAAIKDGVPRLCVSTCKMCPSMTTANFENMAKHPLGGWCWDGDERYFEEVAE